jgi:hypothetical protein
MTGDELTPETARELCTVRTDPAPANTICFNGAGTELLRLSPSGIRANPDLPVDDIARQVFALLEPIIVQAYRAQVDERDAELARLRARLAEVTAQLEQCKAQQEKPNGRD